MMNINEYWKAALAQDANKMKDYFNENAYINWHNTNEHFTVDQFIRANCEYPDSWDGEVERIEEIGDVIITATHVYAKNKPLSFHVVSFIKVTDDKISSIDEYWGDDGLPPQWRLDKHIGTTLK